VRQAGIRRGGTASFLPLNAMHLWPFAHSSLAQFPFLLHEGYLTEFASSKGRAT
jgi:hypothetical protein